ncbi:MAG: EAL domain-containing protein [Lachnospiraceae bacterium]|nr:EAL domain-containing protein [Lachnospiraceae bacterium]
MSTSNNKLTMLVADDSYPIRTLLYEAFSSEYNVITAENGTEAIDVFDEHEDIAIALIDLLMPEVDGFKVISHIVGSKRSFKIPVIAFTASDKLADEIHAVDLGATDVLHKPLNIELLKHKVRNLLTFTAQTAGGDKELMRLIIEQNEIDEKSGLLNKVAFCNAVRRFIDNHHNTKFVTLRFDVDGFKVLNDVYGISEGDRLLRIIGNYMKRNSPEEVIAGRWEADHFVMFMRYDIFNCTDMLNHVDSAVKRDDFGFDIVIRMGVYIVEDPLIDIALMCDRALMALKSIKGDYVKRVAYYDEEMRSNLIEAQQIATEMETALHEGQFVIFLQPQINYNNGKLHGAEALVRWKHPIKGLIPPARFIPIFERNGFITHLDMFVWEEACRLLRKWIDKGYRIVPISVNVSRIDIYSLRLTEHFVALIEKYELDPSLIRIEITESAYIDSPAHLINSVGKLREAGFSVEMDDFGSGYSSLNTLKDVPFDLLKLDMKFIDSNSTSTKGGSILSSVVGMSKRLNLPVLAEGVETKAQADYLKSIGCMYMQGFYFSRPIPMYEFEKILLSNSIEEKKDLHSSDENVDALGFLNASTQHTLIFNNFVGGAAIIEYEGDRVEAIRINDQFYETLDLSREDFSAKSVSLFDYLDDVNKTKFLSTLRRAIEKNGQDECELSVCLKEDQELWLNVGVRLLVTVRGRHLFYLGIENITHKMNLLLNNLRLNEKLMGIMNSIPGGVIDFEVRDGQMLVNYINQAMYEMFGFTQDEYAEIAKSGDNKVVYEDDVVAVRNAEKELIDGRRDSVEISFRHICKDGGFKWIVYSGAVTRRTERGIFATGILLDFDYQMRFEQSAVDTRRTFEKKLALNTALISSFPFGVLQFARRGNNYRLFSCNDASWKFLEFENKAVMMKIFGQDGVRIPVHPDDKRKLDAMIEQVQNGRSSTIAEDRLYVLNGSGGYTPAVVRLQSVVYEGETEYMQYLFMF